jgi:predicted dehydrogenase
MRTVSAPVRLGIVGMGIMGSGHAKNILAGKTPRIQLAAVCDRQGTKWDGAENFADAEALMDSGKVDAVLIATPHYSHTTLGISALERGLHLLVEKPISVHKSDAERLIAAHRGGGAQQFAVMFNQRTDPFYLKIREMIRGGELGEIRRVNWIITNWFRTALYYSGTAWRATWAGEGGGVLLNQAPHNLDLFQWLFGMPVRVRAFCNMGRYHDIEVEDDVTAYMELANGANAVFVTTTGESPGTNRLEIAGELGRLVYENDRLTFARNEVAMSDFSKTAESGFAAPKSAEEVFSISGHGEQHVGILNNFADAILDGAELIASGAEGIRSVELANAMLYSSFTGQTVELPLDGAAYARQLEELIGKSNRS